jgi:hypothetical protein
MPTTPTPGKETVLKLHPAAECYIGGKNFFYVTLKPGARVYASGKTARAAWLKASGKLAKQDRPMFG